MGNEHAYSAVSVEDEKVKKGMVQCDRDACVVLSNQDVELVSSLMSLGSVSSPAHPKSKYIISWYPKQIDIAHMDKRHPITVHFDATRKILRVRHHDQRLAFHNPRHCKQAIVTLRRVFSSNNLTMDSMDWSFQNMTLLHCRFLSQEIPRLPLSLDLIEKYSPPWGAIGPPAIHTPFYAIGDCSGGGIPWKKAIIQKRDLMGYNLTLRIERKEFDLRVDQQGCFLHLVDMLKLSPPQWKLFLDEIHRQFDPDPQEAWEKKEV